MSKKNSEAISEHADSLHESYEVIEQKLKEAENALKKKSKEVTDLKTEHKNFVKLEHSLHEEKEK